MGTDYIVNIGPMVITKNPPRETTETHKVCCNSACRKYHLHVSRGTKFCEECGTQIGDWVKPITRPLKIDFHELLDDRLRPADFHHSDEETVILIANDYSDAQEELAKQVGSARYNLKYGETFQLFPTAEEMHGCVETFKSVFSGELDTLRNLLGHDNVTVKYGVVGVLC